MLDKRDVVISDRFIDMCHKYDKDNNMICPDINYQGLDCVTDIIMNGEYDLEEVVKGMGTYYN